MVNNDTRRKPRELNLEEMIQLIDQQQKQAHTLHQTFEERFETIVDYVHQEKYNKKLHGLIRRAKFRIPMRMYPAFTMNRGTLTAANFKNSAPASSLKII